MKKNIIAKMLAVVLLGAMGMGVRSALAATGCTKEYNPDCDTVRCYTSDWNEVGACAKTGKQDCTCIAY